MRTNIEFLLWALEEEGFIDGSYDTNYIGKHFQPAKLHVDASELDIATIATALKAYEMACRTVIPAAREARDATWRRVARMEGLRKPRM